MSASIFALLALLGYLYIQTKNSIIEHPVYRDRALLSILVSEQDAVSEMQMKL